MSEKAFVTGAGGCVGRQLLAELLAQGWQVTALLLPQETETFAYKDHPAVTSVQGDINNCPAGLVPEGAVIFHLAARVHSVPKTAEQREQFFTVNRDGTAHMAELAVARSAAGFLFLSTIAVYGDQLSSMVCDEQTAPAANSPYGESKLHAEQKLSEILAGKVAYTILRPSVIYGPGDRGNFQRLIRTVLKGRFPVVSGGHARKNTLYVGNLARILVFLAENLSQCDKQVFNVADQQSRSLRQIAQAVAEAAGKAVKITNLPGWLLKGPALVGDLLGKLAKRELPLSSRRLKVMTTDSLVNVDSLHQFLAGRVQLRTFEQGLEEYLNDSSLVPDPQCTILSQLFYPEMVSTGTLLTDLAAALVERGMNVEAIVGQPSYYDFGRAPRRIEYKGVTIRRPLCTWFRKESLPGRLLNSLTYPLGALWYILTRRKKGPFLIVTNPPFLGIVGYLAKRILGARYVCLIHDVYPDLLPIFGLATENSLSVKVLNWMNRRIYSHADRVVVLGRGMKEIMATKDPRPGAHDRIDIIANWSDPQLVVPQDKTASSFYQKTGLSSELVLLYSGNFGRQHDVGLLLKAMDRLRQTDTHLIFIGGGQKKPLVERTIEKEKLTNVSMYPYQPMDEIGQSLTGCDVQVAMLDAEVTGMAVPCKLYGMLASGKPLLVVCSKDGEMGLVVEEEKCGLVVEPGDLDGLLEAIEFFRANPEKRQEMGRRARKAFEDKYTLAHVADRYYQTMCKVQL